MFENSVVESRQRHRNRRKTLTLPISVAFHLLAISGAVLGSVWSARFPDLPPRLYDQLHHAAPLPPMQPASRPAASQLRRSSAEAARQSSTPAATEQAPLLVPSSTPQAAEGAGTASDGDRNRTESAVGSGAGEHGGQSSDTGDGEGGATEFHQGPYRVSGDVRAPVIVRRVDPDYPRMAVATRLTGTVVLECIIDRQGRVREVSVSRGSHPLLDQAAVEAVRQWEFRPGSLSGEMVETIFHLTVRFDLPRR
jgi:periplasmic protein TonB